MNVSYEFPSEKQDKASPTQTDLARAYFFLNIISGLDFQENTNVSGNNITLKKKGGWW